MDQPIDENKKTYEVRIRILGNEVFAIGLISSSDTNRWIVVGMLTTFSLLTIIGAYGEKFVNFYHSIAG